MNTNDIRYLIVLLASEESFAKELASEAIKRNISESIIQDLLKQLLNEECIGITSLVDDDFEDFNNLECMEMVENWAALMASSYQIFLTDSGFKRFDNDSWGITKERALEILFG